MDEIFSKDPQFHPDKSEHAKEVSNKIAIARGSLVLDQPFFGYVLGQFKIVPVIEKIDKFAVDSYHLYFNTEYISNVINSNTNWKGKIKGMLIHLLIHLLFRHHKRQEDRISKLWAYASDIVVFHYLREMREDWIAPSDWIIPNIRTVPSEFIGLGVEETYELLLEHVEQEIKEQENDQNSESKAKEDEKINSGNEKIDQDSLETFLDNNEDQLKRDFGLKGNECDIELVMEQYRNTKSSSEMEELEEQYFEGLLHNAYEKHQGFGDLPGNLKRHVEETLQSQINWKAKLTNYLQKVIIHDLSWTHPNKRLYGQGYILPGPVKENVTVVLGVDTSGSIDDEMLSMFATEAQSILENIINVELVVIDCDAKIQKVTTYHTGESVKSHEFIGKGGTDFRPVLNNLQQYNPDVCIYITDGYGTYQEKEPYIPVLWVLTTDYDPPFGEIIRIDLDRE